MCEIVRSFDCCCKIEIIFSSLSKEELDSMVQFLYKGQYSCSDYTFTIQLTSNLKEYLGFPNDIGIITNQFEEDNLTKVDIETDRQNLRLLPGRFSPTSGLLSAVDYLEPKLLRFQGLICRIKPFL